MLVILVTCIEVFPTVTIDGDAFVIRYGPGLIRKRFRLRESKSCEAVRNLWCYGWGLRLTPHG